MSIQFSPLSNIDTKINENMQIGQTRSLVKTVELMNKPFISIPFYKLNSNEFFPERRRRI